MATETLLSRLLGLLLLGLLLPAHLTGGVGSLNLEELSEMRYGIQILPLPVMGGQVRGVGARVLFRRKGHTAEEEGQLQAPSSSRRLGGWSRLGDVHTSCCESQADPFPGDQAPAGVGLPAVALGSPGHVESTQLPGGEVRAPFPPLTETSWRGLVAYSLFDWALPQGLKRDLVVLDPSLCLPAPLPDPSFPEPSFRRGDCVFEV